VSIRKSTSTKKLGLARETLRALKSSEAMQAVGGMLPESKHTYCGGDTCYKPNPY